MTSTVLEDSLKSQLVSKNTSSAMEVFIFASLAVQSMDDFLY